MDPKKVSATWKKYIILVIGHKAYKSVPRNFVRIRTNRISAKSFESKEDGLLNFLFFSDQLIYGDINVF